MTGFAAAAGFSLLLVRPGMIVIGTPFLGALNAPAHVRVGLIFFLAILMASAMPAPVELPATGLAVLILRELAIGMAIDANVLVFERAREEYAASQRKGLRGAMTTGFEKAWSALLTEVRRVIDAIDHGRYATAGGGLSYVAWGRKPA